MLKPFTILSERAIFEVPNRISLVEAELTTPEDKKVTWHCVAMKDIAVIVPLTADNRVYIKKEWRLNRTDFVWELPSGFVPHENASPEEIAETANRELQEEIGFKAGNLRKLIELYPHNHMRTKMHLFLATDLVPSELPKDEHEFVEPLSLPFDEAYRRVVLEQTPTGQNAVAFLLTKQELNL